MDQLRAKLKRAPGDGNPLVRIIRSVKELEEYSSRLPGSKPGMKRAFRALREDLDILASTAAERAEVAMVWPEGE